MLDRVGYEPPPSAESEATALAQATWETLKSREPVDAESARTKLRWLAGRLVELGQAEEVEKPRLRCWLRRGVRVAGKVLIVVGVAAGGAALIHAIPGVALVHGLAGEMVVEVLKDGVAWALDKTLDRATQAESSIAAEEDPLERVASRAIDAAGAGKIGWLIADWKVAQGVSLDSPSDLDSFLEGIGRPTGELFECLIVAIQLVCEASVGARWASPRIDTLCRQISSCVRQTRAELRKGKCADTELIASALDALRQPVGELQHTLDAAIGHA